MPLSDKAMLGLVNRFQVKVSPHDLGSWSKVEGLDVKFDMPEYRAGDAWNHRWYFPANTKYTNVKLSRAAVKGDTENVRKWLTDVAMKVQPGEVVVELRDAHHDKVCEWKLKDAFPIQWQVNSFAADGSQVAIETLEFVHNGFLDDERKG